MGYTLDGSESIPEPELLGSLPPEYIEDLSSSIEEILRSRSEELVVFLEDDSTGVQKSHNVYLVTQLTRKAIHSAVNAARRAGHRLIFVLTNSRVLDSEKAEDLNRRLTSILLDISLGENITFRFGTRSDSTLRGHFPLEPLTLKKELESAGCGVDGILVSYAFLTDMSRITLNCIHWIREKRRDGSYWYTPVHLTGFAHDKRFRYPTSNLAEYIKYKFELLGQPIRGENIIHIDIKKIRSGPETVRDEILKVKGRNKGLNFIVPDIVSRRDLQVLVLGVLMAEEEGLNLIYRTAASFPPARVNMPESPVLDAKDLNLRKDKGGILCLWGSFVELSNLQLKRILGEVRELVAVEFDVRRILKGEAEEVISQALKKVETSLKMGRPVVVYTVPRMEYPPEEISEKERAENQQRIASSLQEIYNRLKETPGITIFKGGVTSSLGLFNSGAEKVLVLGQISPGIPIVRIQPEDNTRSPGEDALMILGPGNVGVEDTYIEVFEKLQVEIRRKSWDESSCSLPRFNGVEGLMS
ncbi:MAG: four-carbon acid sugar kinase family protein [Candidatus Bathyarchaeia archaeon]|nr:hypothetical protein [Candidatus Bathyarchaeota archaeon]